MAVGAKGERISPKVKWHSEEQEALARRLGFRIIDGRLETVSKNDKNESVIGGVRPASPQEAGMWALLTCFLNGSIICEPQEL